MVLLTVVPFSSDLKRVAVVSDDPNENVLAIRLVDSPSKDEASKLCADRFQIQIPADEWSEFATLNFAGVAITYYTTEADLDAIPTGKYSAVYGVDVLELGDTISIGKHIVELAKVHLKTGSSILHMRLDGE